MKTIFTSVVFLLTFFHLQAQEFQGMAVYESKTSTADFKTRMEGNKNISPDMLAKIEENMKKMFEKTFILNFDKTASIYKQEEKLDAPGQDGGMRMMASFMGGGGTYYKNVKTKMYTVDKEFMGKEFLVKDSLVKINWKLEGETRQIGGYTCFKATALMPANKGDFKNIKLKPEEKKPDGSKPEENKKTNFMDGMEMPKEITVTAWYTPDIPVNQGPESYWGLPGLILEINDGRTVILCSKIVLNPKEKTEIKAPSTGKVVSQKEFDEAMQKKLEEMQQMYKGQGGGPGPGRMRF